MEPKRNGSNFYMLTAQVLNDKNLNHSEKITMAVLTGLADESGKCYPSNDWLCEKLDVKLRAMQDILENLQKNGYIRREIISWANDPFKKYRIIYICTNFKLCLPDAEKCTLENEEKCTLENEEKCTPVMQKSAHIIDKKEVLIDKKECPTSKQASSVAAHPQAAEVFSLLLKAIERTKPDIKRPDSNQWIDQIDLMLRVDNRNIEIVNKLIEWLPTHEFWSINILSADSFRKQFDRLELEMRKDAPKNSSDDLRLIKKLEARVDLVSKGVIITGGDYVEFPKIRDAYFKIGEPAFKQKVLNSLRKMGVPVNE